MSKKNFLGGIGPVVQRELREGARRPVNHRLRFLSAVVGTVLLWILVINYDAPVRELGGYLVGWLNTVVLGLIFVIAPGLTADCIAREKREGTLGLLFLTPLNAGGIVAGKALVAALRAFTLWLAVVPILIIPFIGGGVTWFDALSALSLEFCAMALCLAGGLLASSLARERNTAFVLAYVLGAFFLCVFSLVFEIIFYYGYPASSRMMGTDWLFAYCYATLFLCGINEDYAYPGWSHLGTPGYGVLTGKL
jgi:ABC-type transport system involved in multi-copper enzyme maturation permease subunit